jgi:heterotetrameric sarcosine oxidase gamma subunit
MNRGECRNLGESFYSEIDAQIMLLRETEHRFRIEVWRTFADHPWGRLQAASREMDLDI